MSLLASLAAKIGPRSSPCVRVGRWLGRVPGRGPPQPAGHAVCSCLSFIESVELQLSLCSQTLSIYYLSIIHVHFGFFDYSFFVFEFLIISKGNYSTIRFNLDGLPMVSFAWQQILRFVWMVCMCLISSLTFKFRGAYMADLKKH